MFKFYKQRSLIEIPLKYQHMCWDSPKCSADKNNHWLLMLLIMAAGFQMGIITNNNPNTETSVANLSTESTIYNQNK